MSYYLIFKYKNNIPNGELGSLANDNPKSQYGYEDRKIKYKNDKLAKEILKYCDDVLECYVEYRNG